MVTFEYPGYLPTESFTIKDPDLLDNMASTFNIDLNATQTGVFKSTIQEDFDHYATTLEFSQLCETENDEFIAFLIQAQNHYIKYTDYNSEVWYIQLNSDSIQSNNSPEGYSISLEILRWQ